jgi:phenylacetate-CoA ligase
VRDRRDACWIRATAWRILFEHGFRWSDRTLEIRMRPGRTYGVQRLGIARKDWMSILEPPSRWAERLAERRHACVVAGAGTLEDLAVAARGLALRPPRIVVSDSEPLTPAARRLIHDALGTPPIDVYGLEEVSNFAWECEEREGMHVSADSHLVEVEAATGETGPLLVTALGLRAMPVIRYRTGDLATATARDCRCGRTLPLLAAVHGRAVESIDLPGGRRLLWPFFHELLAAEPAVRQWQVQQTATDEILVRVVLGSVVPGSADGGITDRLRTALGSRLRSETRLIVDMVDTIPPEANGKRRLMIPLAR